jgi:hypothetical protein
MRKHLLLIATGLILLSGIAFAHSATLAEPPNQMQPRLSVQLAGASITDDNDAAARITPEQQTKAGSAVAA